MAITVAVFLLFVMLLSSLKPVVISLKLILYINLFVNAVNDFSLVTSDISLRNPATEIDIDVTITNDGIAGEPPETFTITSQPPVISSRADPPFLFRDTAITIIHANSKSQGVNAHSL